MVRIRYVLKVNPKPIDSITLAVEISPKAMRTQPFTHPQNEVLLFRKNMP